MARRSLEQILAAGDALAAQFEAHEPGSTPNAPVDPDLRVRLAAIRRSTAERELADAVRDAREAGRSWDAIGRAIGVSGQAARQRYATTAESPGGGHRLPHKAGRGKTVAGRFGTSKSIASKAGAWVIGTAATADDAVALAKELVRGSAHYESHDMPTSELKLTEGLRNFEIIVVSHSEGDPLLHKLDLFEADPTSARKIIAAREEHTDSK